ncbi:PEP-CTERM sorting domain-containing protein [Poriferisphaera corsica]|uniref:PEP-CTERM sorting domain-containing protein n=1 Tax=Poriferisphaera corsica TaxID=2528020 RepID=UPI0011A8DEFC
MYYIHLHHPSLTTGSFTFTGPINNFSIGGQELHIDNVSYSAIPEPASLALLSLGSLALLRSKH